MKIVVLAFCLSTLSATFAYGQADTARLLAEIKNKLNDHSSTVSKVLSDPAYDKLHPHTSFRELIKKYSDDGTLSIVNDKESGKRIKVIATLLNNEGKPVPGALVYLYQTDARGWYSADAPHVLAYEGDMRHARLFGYGKTDKQGKLELHTVKPSGYPNSDLPAHIHVHVTAKGYSVYGTEFLFDDDERLVGDIRSRAVQSRFIISKPEPAEAPFSQQFSFGIALRANE